MLLVDTGRSWLAIRQDCPVQGSACPVDASGGPRRKLLASSFSDGEGEPTQGVPGRTLGGGWTLGGRGSHVSHHLLFMLGQH